MQAKDIPDEAILDIVRMFNEGRQPQKVIPGRMAWAGTAGEFWIPDYVLEPHPMWCLTYDLEERMPDVPPKVILAKCRSLILRGKMHGCYCGCRGDFYLDGYGW